MFWASLQSAQQQKKERKKEGKKKRKKERKEEEEEEEESLIELSGFQPEETLMTASARPGV